MMSLWFITLVTILYMGAAISLLFEGKSGYATMFFGYVIANLGFMYALYK